jgi:hypothetical protein
MKDTEKTNKTYDLRIPEGLDSEENLRECLRQIFTELTNPDNYSARRNGDSGCLDLCELAGKGMQKAGFGKDAARLSSHPFHWIMTDAGLVGYHPATKPGEDYCLWTLEQEKVASIGVDGLVKMFIEGYQRGDRRKEGLAEVFVGKINHIRENPSNYQNN